MKHIAPTTNTNTEHRRSRLIAWARLLLFWVGALMFRDSMGRISERHLLVRGFYANLDRVAATINNIILLHACAKLGTVAANLTRCSTSLAQALRGARACARSFVLATVPGCAAACATVIC